MRSPCYITALILLIASDLSAQSLDQVGKDKAIKTNGGIALSTVFYDAEGIAPRRDPFYWIVNANVSFNVLGVAVPFSATFTSQGTDVSQPFNQYGLSPTYKAVTAHLGWRSLSYSQFTLSGVQFLGAGVELEPDKKPFYFSALYGRFAKAVDPISVAEKGGIGLPAYERWGYGAKFGYKSKYGTVGLILFRGKDDPTSISLPPPSAELQPGANLVLGLEGKTRLTKTTGLSMEFAHSIYTQNLLLGEQKLQTFTYADNLGGLIPVNQSTTESNAFKVSVDQDLKIMAVNLTYRRLDPNYQSMGTPFINNDVEHITGGVQLPLFKRKVNLNGNAGFQRDNLDNAKKDRMIRLVANLNASIQLKSWWNINLTAANFNSNTYKVRMVDLDSLQYYQVTQNYMLSNMWSFGKNDFKHSLMATGNLQKVEDSQGTGSVMRNVLVGYNATMVKLRAGFGLTGNYFLSTIDTLNVAGYGPSFTFNKKLLESGKLITALSYTYLINSRNGVNLNDNHSMGVRIGYPVKKRHSISVQGNIIQKTTYTAQPTQFTEYKAMFNYAFTF